MTNIRIVGLPSIVITIFLVLSLNTGNQFSQKASAQDTNMTTVDNTTVTFPLGNMSGVNATSGNATVPAVGAVPLPTTRITSVTDGLGDDVPNYSATDSRTINIEFQSSRPYDDLSQYFTCYLGTKGIPGCNSPLTLRNLSISDHVFKVYTTACAGEICQWKGGSVTWHWSVERSVK